MRKRKRRSISLPTLNLDSFLDILTNIVGLLMFISLFITLFTIEAGKLVRTPLASKSDKTPIFFEIRNNRVIYIDDAKVERELGYLMQSLPKCPLPDAVNLDDSYMYKIYLNELKNYESCHQNAINRLKNFQVETNFYRVRLYDLDSLVYEPLNQEVGDSIDQLSAESSQFETILQEINPQNHYLAFIVRPDSFSAFRIARAQAWKAGFEVGWEPHNTNIPIVFGTGGRAIGVQ
jgi:hypothetical protein